MSIQKFLHTIKKLIETNQSFVSLLQCQLLKSASTKDPERILANLSCLKPTTQAKSAGRE